MQQGNNKSNNLIQRASFMLTKLLANQAGTSMFQKVSTLNLLLNNFKVGSLQRDLWRKGLNVK